MLKMDLEYKKEILFCRLTGNLNQKNSYKLNDYLTPVVKKHGIKYLVYNLAGLKDIDAIINSKWEIKKNKGKLIICKGKPNILEKLKRLRIPSVTCERRAYSLKEA